MKRRSFVEKAALGTIGLSTVLSCKEIVKKEEIPNNDVVLKSPNKPVIISTWNHGLPANEETWNQLKSGKSALDAIEAGLMIPEADPKVRSVGFGGFPDREEGPIEGERPFFHWISSFGARGLGCCSNQDLLNHLPMHIRQPTFHSIVVVGQSLVAEAQEVQDLEREPASHMAVDDEAVGPITGSPYTG